MAVSDGSVIASAGDPHILTFLRSSAKPVQALPLVRTRPDLGDREIAIACASHLGRPEQIDAVRRLLAAAPAREEELETGPEPTPIGHNCSGKHAGFLALCRARGWESAGYRLPGHPVQRTMLSEVAAAAEVDEATLATATDGCGVVTFALPLDRFAHLFGRLPGLDGGPRIVRAMRAHPEMLRGPVATDVMLMETLDGWVAKGGAEGLLCACSPDGLGIALKAEDGAFRALRPAVAAFLRSLDIQTGSLGVVAVDNSRGEPVGEVIARV